MRQLALLIGIQRRYGNACTARKLALADL